MTSETKQPSLDDFDNSYTLEALQEMRKLGLPRPADVSEELWDLAIPPAAPKSQLELEIEAALAANPKVATGDKSMFGLLFPYIIKEAARILSDPAEATKNKIQIMQWAGDQHAGKASQHIEHSGNIQLELRKAAAEMAAMDKQIAALRSRDVFEVAATNSEQLDPAAAKVDAFLDAKIGEVVQVGQRGTDAKES